MQYLLKLCKTVRPRLSFGQEGLSPQDALLDVGATTVRLASLSGCWPQQEAPWKVLETC